MYTHCSASGFKLLDAPSPSYAFREFLKRSRDKHRFFSQPAHHPPPPLTHARRTRCLTYPDGHQKLDWVPPIP